MASGVVYLVATPVGNLEDITLRALRILREVDLIACEDTRHTGRLLRHFGIENRLISCHDHNEAERAAEIAQRAADGLSVALVSDAGTPCVSDPGFRVVRAALDRGIRVVPVPGPSAAIAAQLFLPPRKAKRREALLAIKRGLDAGPVRGPPAFSSRDSCRRARRSGARLLATRAWILVLYEAPHRLADTLADIRDVLGDRPVAVARELTKVHEEFVRGTAGSVLDEFRSRPAIKGELVVLVAAAGAVERRSSEPLAARVAELERSGLKRMNAIKQAAREQGISKRDAYAQVEAASSGRTAKEPLSQDATPEGG